MAFALQFEYFSARFEIAMANQHVAFDESGKTDCEPVVFAGLLSLPDRWIKMSEQWNKTLEGEGLTYWRSSSAAALNGPFKIFRERRKDLEKLTLEVTRIACEFALSGCVNSITMAAYKKLDDAARKRYKDPFYFAFDAGIMQLMQAEDIPVGDIFTLVCDDSDDSQECLRVYRHLRSLHPEIANRIGGICFQDDKIYPPVQAADLFAYCHRKKAGGDAKGVWADAMRMFDETFSITHRGEIRG